MKEVYQAKEAAQEIGITYSRLIQMIRSGKAHAKKNGLAITNPWQLHVSEVMRLKEIFAPPTAVTFAQAAG